MSKHTGSNTTGKFIWFECVTSDPAKAKGFYGELFGWGVQEEDMGGGNKYAMITNGGVPIGGYGRHDGKSPPHWTSYLAVEDVDASVAKVKGAGGQLVEQPFDIPTVGRMAKIADPQGATFWIMRGSSAEPMASGPAVGGFCWNELYARDAAKAVTFYKGALGYTTREKEMPNGTYHVLIAGGEDRGGVMTTPKAEMPPMWLPYVAVSDCDAVAARAKKLGGTVHEGPHDIPEIGRFAIIGDSAGGAIAVIRLNPNAM